MLSQKIRAPRGRLSVAAIAQGTNSWTNREKIALIEAVQSTATDDWNEVSKYMYELTKATRTKDWCSPINCGRQFQIVMETVGRQIRKKGDMEKDLLTSIRQHFVDERLKELQVIAEDHLAKYLNLSKFHKEVLAGKHDDRSSEILSVVGNEPDVDETPDEGPGIFYFAELSDLSDKVSRIHSFLRNEIEITPPATTSSPPKQGGIATAELTAPSVSGMTMEDEEDLSDLMDVLPTMETFDADDLDATLMDTSEFEIASPLDGTTAARKVSATSPKVSPQLKNLVRTAIAGTSEDEKPRKMTPSSGAPTLSMLLEMPPRDPGQPLPEISTVSKAAQNTIASINEHHKLEDTVSPFKSAPVTLEHLNIALDQSPTKHQDKQIPSTSSSPTLQRLLEGTVSIKKEVGDSKPSEAPIIAGTSATISEVEIKKEELEEFEISTDITTSATVVKNSSDSVPARAAPLPSNVIAEKATLKLVVSNPEISVASPEVGSISALDSEVVHDVYAFDATEGGPEVQKSVKSFQECALEEPKEVIEIKTEEVEISLPEDYTELPEIDTISKEVEVQPLPPDLQDKVSNLKDLVITQNVGIVSPKVSPAKIDTRVSSEEALPGSNITSDKSIKPVPLVEETKVTITTSIPAVKEVLMREDIEKQELMDVSGEDSSVTMPVLTPVPSLVVALPQHSDVKADAVKEVTPTPAPLPEAETMEEATPYETTAEDQNLDKEAPTVTDLPDITDSDDDISNRKKVLIPSKTYSRKERYGIEPPQIDEEDDSSNSGFETSIKTTPDNQSLKTLVPRSSKSPTKAITSSPDKKGRKSRFSESKNNEVEGGAEEETRVTRARSKPASPTKAISKLGTRTPEPVVETSVEQPQLATRATRSRATVVGSHAGTSEIVSQSAVSSRKSIIPAEEREIQTPPDLDLHAPGRTMRGRISSTSTSRVLESLPGIAFESNPSSPSSSTTTSTNMDEDKEQRAFRKSLSILWDQIKSHKHAGQFLKPITDTMVPKYSRKILRPMDLTTIKRHIDSGIIRTVQTFERDVYLMLMNATMYNSWDHEIHQRTLEMEQDVRTIIDNYKATQKALRASQSNENAGTESVTRSRTNLRNRGRRVKKSSESDGDDPPVDGTHSGVHTPVSGTDNDTDDMESDRQAGQKTREGSPDIVSLASGAGNKRRSRTSSPSSVHIAISSAAEKTAERASSVERRLRQTSPDVNSPTPSRLFDQ